MARAMGYNEESPWFFLECVPTGTPMKSSKILTKGLQLRGARACLQRGRHNDHVAVSMPSGNRYPPAACPRPIQVIYSAQWRRLQPQTGCGQGTTGPDSQASRLAAPP